MRRDDPAPSPQEALQACEDMLRSEEGLRLMLPLLPPPVGLHARLPGWSSMTPNLELVKHPEREAGVFWRQIRSL